MFTLGVYAMITTKYPIVGRRIRFSSAGFNDCSHVLITGREVYVASVQHVDGVRYFEYKKQRFVYQDQAFVLYNAVLQHTAAQIHDMKGGKTTSQAMYQAYMCGDNRILIDDVPVTTMVLHKCTEAFYIFQMASVAIWIYIGYVTYSILILVMSVASVGWEVYQAKTNEMQLRSLTRLDADFFVVRDGAAHKVSSEDLIVGDAVLLDCATLPIDTKLPCDMVLVQGECVVDESSLTGETVPVLKVSLPRRDGIVDGERNRSSMLFGGSVIKQLKPKDDRFRSPEIIVDTNGISRSSSIESIQDRKMLEMDQLPVKKRSVIAIVYATGFSTAKGQLFRSILFPSEIEFKYAKDSIKFLAILGVIAVLAATNRIVDSVRSGQTLLDAILSSLDLITIAVPPALPLILTVGVGFSLQRLKQVMIYCINPERLNYAGRLDTMCWDKTGTITVSKLLFDSAHKTDLSGDLDFSGEYVSQHPMSIERSMIACHGVSFNGTDLSGHSLDVESFERTGWSISKSFPETVRYHGISLHVTAVVQLLSQPSIYILQRLSIITLTS